MFGYKKSLLRFGYRALKVVGIIGDPQTQETITVQGTELVADVTNIAYIDGHSEDTISVEGTELLVDYAVAE